MVWSGKGVSRAEGKCSRGRRGFRGREQGGGRLDRCLVLLIQAIRLSQLCKPPQKTTTN